MTAVQVARDADPVAEIEAEGLALYARIYQEAMAEIAATAQDWLSAVADEPGDVPKTV